MRLRVCGLGLRTLVLGLLLTLLLGARAGADVAHAAPLLPNCEAIVERGRAFEGRMGIVVIDLQGGDYCSLNPHGVFVTASLYKVIVLAEAYRQEAEGTFAFDESLAVPAALQEDTPPEDRAPYSVSGAQAARLMLQVSDNATALALRQRLGGEDLTAAPARLGMRNTSLGGDEFTTTPEDIALLFRRLYQGDVVSPTASAEIVELLYGQQVVDRIPAALPAGTRVANKTGNLDAFAHDAAIASGPGGDVLIVALTEAGGGATVDDAYEAIRDVAALAFEVVAAPRAIVATDAAQAGYPGEPVVLSAPAVALEPVADGIAADAAQTSDGGVGAPPLVLIEDAGEGLRTWWPAAAAATAALVLLPGGLYLRRRARGAPSNAPRQASARTVAAAAHHPGPSLEPRPSRGSMVKEIDMRFGARASRDEESSRGPSKSASKNPSKSKVESGYLEAAVARGDEPESETLPESERLRRLAGYFRAQGELLEELSRQVEAETQPLATLLDEQRVTMQQTLGNLEERLRPLKEYAASEERNLEQLEGQMDAGGMDFVARSFSEYLEAQRRRLAETRQQIDEQRRPFLRHADQQRDAVEAALARFDDDLLALEDNLAEQRKVMMRMLDAMRSESFVAAREFLVGREAAIREAARERVTDPAELAARLRPLRERVTGEGAPDYLRRLLAITDQADSGLADAARQIGGPRPVPRTAAPPALNEADDEEDGEEERTA